MYWTFVISFVASNEAEKQEKEKWLDNLFSPTSFRRTITKEKLAEDKCVITFEDTGARHNQGLKDESFTKGKTIRREGN